MEVGFQGSPPRRRPLPRVTLALTSGRRLWAGLAGRARAARGTPGRPGPHSPPHRTGTVRPARCLWPPHRAAAGPPHRGSVGRGGGEGPLSWAAAPMSRGLGTQDPGDGWSHPGLTVSPGAPAALGKTRSFGTAGKAHLRREAGGHVTAPRSGPALSPHRSSAAFLHHNCQNLRAVPRVGHLVYLDITPRHPLLPSPQGTRKSW